MNLRAESKGAAGLQKHVSGNTGGENAQRRGAALYGPGLAPTPTEESLFSATHEFAKLDGKGLSQGIRHFDSHAHFAQFD